MQNPTPHPTQASTTPKNLSLNVTGAMAMADGGRSQGQPTRKRSSQAANENVADATSDRLSKKFKTTKSNEPRLLHRTGICSMSSY